MHQLDLLASDMNLNSWRITGQNNVTMLSLRFTTKCEGEAMTSQVEHHYRRKSPSTVARDMKRYVGIQQSKQCAVETQVDYKECDLQVSRDASCGVDEPHNEHYTLIRLPDYQQTERQTPEDSSLTHSDSTCINEQEKQKTNPECETLAIDMSSPKVMDSAESDHHDVSLAMEPNTSSFRSTFLLDINSDHTQQPDPPCTASVKEDQLNRDMEDWISHGAPRWMAVGLTDILRRLDNQIESAKAESSGVT